MQIEQIQEELKIVGIEVEIDETIMRIWRDDVFCGAHKYSAGDLAQLLTDEHQERADRLAQRQAARETRKQALCQLTERVAVLEKNKVIAYANVREGASFVEVATYHEDLGGLDKPYNFRTYKVSRAKANLRKCDYVQPLNYFNNETYTFQNVSDLGEIIY